MQSGEAANSSEIWDILQLYAILWENCVTFLVYDGTWKTPGFDLKFLTSTFDPQTEYKPNQTRNSNGAISVTDILRFVAMRNNWLI